MAAILTIRFDVPTADPATTDPNEITTGIFNYFNAWACAYEVPEVGTQTLTAEWADTHIDAPVDTT
jgi:hypothetical protein